jgi:hypothetical protein
MLIDNNATRVNLYIGNKYKPMTLKCTLLFYDGLFS